MSATSPSVLLLEDDAADARLIEQALARHLPRATVGRATNRREYLERLADGPVDVVLADGGVPGCAGIEAFHLAQGRSPGTPFFFLSGGPYPDDCPDDRPDDASDDRPGNGAGDLRALRALGVIDCLTKDRLDEVGRAVGAALTRREEWIDVARLAAGQDVLLALTWELTQATDLAALTAASQQAARRLTGADGVSFAVREGDECHYTDEDPPGPLWKGLRFPLGECLSGWSMRHRQPLVLDDVSHDDRVPPACRHASVRSAVIVPVRAARPVAALGVYWTTPHELDTTQVRLLTTLADGVASGLQNLQAKRALEARARDSAAELAALTYAVSHDLRAPIRHVEGFARILQQDVVGLDEGVQHAVQRIQDAGGHLRSMVEGMLTLSRVAQSDVHPQPTDLAELGRQVAAALAAAPTPADRPEGADGVKFVAPEHLPVLGDPRLLLQLLQELLGNAWKFTARVPHPRVELGVRTDDPTTPEYFVRDDGVGFEPGSADRLFGAFQRLHGPDEFAGVGVGLATVKRIVVKHGGDVRAEGRPDEGASFFFTLPGG